MSTILKRFVRTDSYGRPLTATTEHLEDLGNGRLYLNVQEVLGICSGCGRPVADPNDLRGVCHFCLSRSCCVHCETRCAACSRRLCMMCRRGFAGQSPLTLCPICLSKMEERQRFQDRLLEERTIFEGQVVLQRERARVLASGVLNRLPGGRALTTIGQLNVLRKLKHLEQSLTNRGGHHGRYLR